MQRPFERWCPWNGPPVWPRRISACAWRWRGATNGRAGSIWPSSVWNKRWSRDPNESLLRYNLACYLSLAGQKRTALAYLSQVFAADPVYRELIATESDFDPIRCDPEFQALCAKVDEKGRGSEKRGQGSEQSGKA